MSLSYPALGYYNKRLHKMDPIITFSILPYPVQIETMSKINKACPDISDEKKLEQYKQIKEWYKKDSNIILTNSDIDLFINRVKLHILCEKSFNEFRLILLILALTIYVIFICTAISYKLIQNENWFRGCTSVFVLIVGTMFSYLISSINRVMDLNVKIKILSVKVPKEYRCPLK
jgi:hypothetical protein